MTCSVCGNPYPCVHSGRRTSVLLDTASASAAEALAGSSQKLAASMEGPARSASPTGGPENINWSAEQAWRQEVASRVQQHRARRRKRFDPNAPELDFPVEAPISFVAPPQDDFPSVQSLRADAPSVRPEPKII